jgi:TPP-dependent pyruvate/acetoin dehydrogenase alpha subunit
MFFKKKIKKLFYEMLRIRMVEIEISKKYKNMKMRCPVHLSIGQESSAIGVCQNLINSDEVVTAHRSHAHYLAKGGDLKKMIAELHGKIGGCVNGLGGSMHLLDLKKNITAAVPIVGSTLPIGVGKAWANQLIKNKNVVVIFFGDGATEEGVFFESIDFAILKKLRVLFVCENNQYSVYSKINKRQHKNRNLIKIAKSFGMKSSLIKTHDLKDIYIKSRKILKNIRINSKPYFLQINTWRYSEHCGVNNDDNLGYRNKADLKKWLKLDQIKKYQEYVLSKKIISYTALVKMKEKINLEINKAFNFSYSSPYPPKKYLKKFIYSND